MSADAPEEGGGWRAALLTYAPAVVFAFVLYRALVALGGWELGRARITSVGAGIALALVLQRVHHHRGGS